MARNYESNGPDVKIRGTAAHIAEKYMSLARDALAAGDTVSAESYLQHAEHYNRIIMAAQVQLGPQGAQAVEGANGGHRQSRWHSDADDDGSEGETAEAGGAQGGGSQDRERHVGNREHHPGGHDRGRSHRGPNGAEGARDVNGTEPAEAGADESETAPDQVS